jgi:hypothetical protein
LLNLSQFILADGELNRKIASISGKQISAGIKDWWNMLFIVDERHSASSFGPVDGGEASTKNFNGPRYLLSK